MDGFLNDQQDRTTDHHCVKNTSAAPMAEMYPLEDDDTETFVDIYSRDPLWERGTPLV